MSDSVVSSLPVLSLSDYMNIDVKYNYFISTFNVYTIVDYMQYIYRRICNIEFCEIILSPNRDV
jgi:hypothetical protein